MTWGVGEAFLLVPASCKITVYSVRCLRQLQKVWSGGTPSMSVLCASEWSWVRCLTPVPGYCDFSEGDYRSWRRTVGRLSSYLILVV